MVEERRKSERYPLQLPIRIELVDSEQEKETLDLLTSNISEGGTFIPTHEPIPKGTCVQVRLILVNDTVKKLSGAQGCILVGGTVVRAGSIGIAICFDKDCWHKRLNQFHTPNGAPLV